MDVMLSGKIIRLDATKRIGIGGEAEVYALNNRAVKIFKPPTHIDFQNDAKLQQDARERIAEHQKKLKAFPKGLPSGVITPLDLVFDKTGASIVGYAMMLLGASEPLIRYGQKPFRSSGIADQAVVEIFQNLHRVVQDVHRSHVVIGDFNDLNVLVQGTQSYLIDADSMQFGSFVCRQYTTRFVDPLLCNPKAASPILQKPHSDESDWYAFAVMLMQCLLFVDPYGGVYRPKDPKKTIAPDKRALHRITVFHPDVRYPKPATPYSVLPDEVLERFHQIFEKDVRGIFPFDLLNEIRWTTCATCGNTHARKVCPFCKQPTAAAIKEVVRVHGTVIARQVFATKGAILAAAFQNEKLLWLFHADGALRREDGTIVRKGVIAPGTRFRIQKSSTLEGVGSDVTTYMRPDEPTHRLVTDRFGDASVVDANAKRRYWVYAGNLMRDGDLGKDFPVTIGNVLQDQTLFWVGSEFGFGFYRAQNMTVAFVFDADGKALKDTVALDPIRGQLVDATCAFANDRCWFFTTTQESGKLVNRCTVIRRDGTIEAKAEQLKDDGSWLSSIRGKSAVGQFLFVPSDDGIIRVDITGNVIHAAKVFEDTESFVNEQSKLFATKQGIYVVNPHDITLLTIK